jgi:hypothetical protein
MYKLNQPVNERIFQFIICSAKYLPFKGQTELDNGRHWLHNRLETDNVHLFRVASKPQHLCYRDLLFSTLAENL